MPSAAEAPRAAEDGSLANSGFLLSFATLTSASNAATTVLSVETKNRSMPLVTSDCAPCSTSSGFEIVCSISSTLSFPAASRATPVTTTELASVGFQMMPYLFAAGTVRCASRIASSTGGSAWTPVTQFGLSVGALTMPPETANGSTIELNTSGGLPSAFETFSMAWYGGVAMATTRSGLASLKRWAMLLTVPTSAWPFWKSTLRLVPSLKPLSDSASSVPLRAASRAGCETNWMMPSVQLLPEGACATTE